MKKYRAPSDISQRLWSKVKKSDTCWNWTAKTNDSGYGVFRVASHRHPVPELFGFRYGLAHRVSWILRNGRIEPGLCVCHSCDNRKCVNPSHLFLGTHTENMRDCAIKGRRIRPCGELNPKAKLTTTDVEYIRRNKGVKSHTQLAEQFGVYYSTIYKIWNREVWNHGTTTAAAGRNGTLQEADELR